MKVHFFARFCVVIIVVSIAFFLAGMFNVSSQAPEVASFSSQEHGLGSEYQLSVSSNPETDRYAPASAYNPTLRQTFVVWHRNGGGNYYIEGRLLDAHGKPLVASPIILVSGSTPVYQPAIAYDAETNHYLVVWMRNTLLDGKTYAIWGKILDANLSEIRPEYPVFTPPANYACWSPRVAWNAKADEYMVVWNTYNIAAFPSMFPDNISQETLYANGDSVGHILVIGNTPGNMIYPNQIDLVYANDYNWGTYLWVWRQVKPGTADFDIWAANIDANAGGYLPSLPPFPVDQSPSDQQNPRIATNGANDFMVVWQERAPNSPNDWDIRGREMNQIGTFFGGVHVIAGWGSTEETTPFVAGWPGATSRYVVGYERSSETGKGIWLAYYNNGANTIHISDYIFWLDNFAAAEYAFWANSYPTGVIAGSRVLLAYQGVSNMPHDHPQIYGRAWTPFLAYLPSIRK